jgi:hypothetical protein
MVCPPRWRLVNAGDYNPHVHEEPPRSALFRLVGLDTGSGITEAADRDITGEDRKRRDYDKRQSAQERLKFSHLIFLYLVGGRTIPARGI